MILNWKKYCTNNITVFTVFLISEMQSWEIKKRFLSKNIK